MSVVSALRVMFLDMPHSPANIIILRVLYLVVRIFRNILTYRVCGPAFPLHLRARKLSPFSFVELGLFCSEVALQQYRTTECTSCWILRIKCSGLVVCVRVCVCFFFCAASFCLSTLSSAYLWNYAVQMLYYITTPGWMQVDCGLWAVGSQQDQKLR